MAEARRRAGANCSIVVGGVAEIFLQSECVTCLLFFSPHHPPIGRPRRFHSPPTHLPPHPADEKTECVRLRKGFIREALRNGYDLVPMFHFGNTRIYK